MQRREMDALDKLEQNVWPEGKRRIGLQRLEKLQLGLTSKTAVTPPTR